jgi:hypothetical protein
MTITLNLPPEKQAELERRAAASGTDVTTFIQSVVAENLEEELTAEFGEASFDQWQAEFRAWIARQRSRNPNVDDSRESIYD